MGFDEVSTVMWRERRLLEVLLFRLEEEQLLLAAGRTRWLSAATADVELVLDEIRTVELGRSVLVDELAEHLGLGPSPSLRELVRAAPEPWRTIFEEHRGAFLALTDEIVGLAQANRDLVSRGQRAAQELLASMDEHRLDLYGPEPPGQPRAASPLLVDEVL
ncbi:MAG: flagellar protein FlgN [Acidimicrobiia bacterium]